MISKRWFRFGLPLGSAAIVAAMLDTTIGAYWLLNDVGSSLFFHWWDHSKPIDKTSIINVALISTRLGLALSLWLFVLMKQRSVLIFWLPFSVFTDILFIGQAILNHPDDFISDEWWICNIFFLFLFRFYITAVIFQTLVRLLRNARLKVKPILPKPNSTSSSSTHPDPEENDEDDDNGLSTLPRSVKYYLVEPIGRNPYRIWKYYDQIPRLGAAVLVAFEISWTLFALSTHVLTDFLFGGHLFFLHKEEEIVMRIWRIILGSFALILILKKRKAFLRFWLVFYFWTMFISIALTIWTVVEWTFETPLVVVLVICYSALSDIILRFCVLYFCLMLSLQTSLSISRTQSLKSETRSVRPHTSATVSMMPNHTSGKRNQTLADRIILTGNQL